MIELKEIEEKARLECVSKNLILKEYLHFAVLEFLFKKGFFSHLVFQGGTALRIAYKGIRYSEDLDFVLSKKNAGFLNTLEESLKQLPKFMEKLLPVAKNIVIKMQKDDKNFKRFTLVMDVESFPAKDKTNIEIMNVPSYFSQTMILRDKDIPLTPAIVVEKPEEILSDKFLAFASRDYIKGRDLWDIYFILTTLNIPVDDKIKKMLIRKIADYDLTHKKFISKFSNNLAVLSEKGETILKQEMNGFLPASYRNIFEYKYIQICRNNLKILTELFEELK